MRSTTWKISASALAMAVTMTLALGLTAPAPVAAEPDGEAVKIKKIVRCESGDCTETVEEIGAGDEIEVVVGDGGGKHVIKRRIHCEGEDCSPAEGAHKMVFVGGDGGVEILSGDGGHAWIIGRHGGGFLGVGLTELTGELREHFGVGAEAGVMVSKVVADSPAFKAGVEVGDIITAIDGEAVASGSALARRVRGRDAGDEVTLEVWRDGAVRSITAAVEERERGLHASHMDETRRHMGDMGGPGEQVKKIVVECESGDGECRSSVDIAGLDDFDCGTDECQVEVQCQNGECTCTVNGESADCAGIPGVPGE